MKVTVGLVQTTTHGNNYTDLNLKLDATKTESGLLTQHNVPMPGAFGTTQALVKKCFPTHGDFFREVGVSNFRTFQPDWSYFQASQSSGWRKFIAKLVSDENRDEILERIGHIILTKLSLLTRQVTPVIVEGKLKSVSRSPTNVKLVDTTGKTVEFRVGNQIFKTHEITEDAKSKTLLDRAKTEMENKATAQVSGFQSEFSNNLSTISKQYEKTIADMKKQIETNLPALNISPTLCRQGVIVTSTGIEYQIFIPIKLHYTHVVTEFQVWKLKKAYQIKQEGFLMIAVDRKLNFRWGHIYDKKFENHVILWHLSGGQLCLGSYEVNMKRLEDIVRIRDEIADMYSKINTQSLAIHNIPGGSPAATIQHRIYSDRQYTGYTLSDGNSRNDLELSEIATLIKDKQPGGTVWST